MNLQIILNDLVDKLGNSAQACTAVIDIMAEYTDITSKEGDALKKQQIMRINLTQDKDGKMRLSHESDETGAVSNNTIRVRPITLIAETLENPNDLEGITFAAGEMSFPKVFLDKKVMIISYRVELEVQYLQAPTVINPKDFVDSIPIGFRDFHLLVEGARKDIDVNVVGNVEDLDAVDGSEVSIYHATGPTFNVHVPGWDPVRVNNPFLFAYRMISLGYNALQECPEARDLLIKTVKNVWSYFSDPKQSLEPQGPKLDSRGHMGPNDGENHIYSKSDDLG